MLENAFGMANIIRQGSWRCLNWSEGVCTHAHRLLPLFIDRARMSWRGPPRKGKMGSHSAMWCCRRLQAPDPIPVTKLVIQGNRAVPNQLDLSYSNIPIPIQASCLICRFRMTRCRFKKTSLQGLANAFFAYLNSEKRHKLYEYELKLNYQFKILFIFYYVLLLYIWLIYFVCFQEA